MAYLNRLWRSKLVLKFIAVNICIYSAVLGCIGLALCAIWSVLGLPFWLGCIAFLVVTYFAYNIGKPTIDARGNRLTKQLAEDQQHEDWLNGVEDAANNHYERLSNISKR